MLTYFKSFLEGYNRNAPHHWQPNCTDWYVPTLMYPLLHLNGFRNILEIGQAEGYSSYYLATAAKENKGTFLAIDICDTYNRPHEPYGYSLKRFFEGEELPARFIQADTKQMESIPSYADGGLDIIDFAFIDGEHTTEAVLHEVENLILPKMRKDGMGYICFDDVFDMGAEGAWAVFCSQPERFECLTIFPNGGFGIMRVKKVEPKGDVADGRGLD